jgi:hypothetical protein
MRFLRSFIATLALFAVGTTAAYASEKITFKHEGVTYIYRVIDKGDRRIITGTSETFGKKQDFRLVIQNGKVRGEVAGEPIRFASKEAKAGNIRLASD